jgi:hypothetical protein
VCPRRLDETAVALKSRRRDSNVNQPSKPNSAADAEGVHLSKVKLAAIVTAERGHRKPEREGARLHQRLHSG